MKGLNVDVQSFIDMQEHPFVLIDGAYRIVAANRAYCAAYGVNPETIVGRHCHEVSHHSPVPCHQKGEHCPHWQVFSTGGCCEVLHTHFDQLDRPEHVRLKGHPVRGADGALYLGETIFPLASGMDLDCNEMRMIGRSPAFLACIDNLTCAAESDAPVLLYGESGVGKELAARYVHQRSTRNGKPYLALDCAALSEPLFESELFGHERGAFTGCIGRKQGLFELAHGGTLFMDEIGEVPLTLQAKLLRLLESGEFRRVGGREVLQADVRIVSATNRRLLDMVDQGLFRQDLFYRISGIDITLPPLRERRSDIPALAEAILARIGRRDAPRYRLTREASTRLMSHDYPGNVRELRNILLKAAALSENGVIAAPDILFYDLRSAHGPAPADTAPAPAGNAPSSSMSQLEAHYIAQLLARHNGHRRTVAGILGISERTLYRKLHRYRLHTA